MNESLQLSYLNDDCLRELFSRLPNIDLCAIKDACRRFKTIANEVAKQRFRNLYECHPTDENLQEHKIILKKFGRFVLTMSLSSGSRKDSTGPITCFMPTRIEDITSLLTCCTSLVGLYLDHFYARHLHTPLNEVCENLGLLEFISCPEADNERELAAIVSACNQLQVCACYGGSMGYTSTILRLSTGDRIMCIRSPEPARVYSESSTVKHVTLLTYRPDELHTHLPTPEDMTKLFTLELIPRDSQLASNIDFLAKTNASLVNLMLHMPAHTEDLGEISKSLCMWTNLMSYDIIAGFQLPQEIFGLFPNLIYVGRSKCLREWLLIERMTPEYIYRYKWTRNSRLFQAGSDEESRFRAFPAWREEMKELGLHIDTM